MAEEKKIGFVEKFYGKIGVAAVILSDDALASGETIRIKGHTTDFEQKVDSIEIEHKHVNLAGKGTSIGIRVKERVREHDKVFKITT